MIELLWTDQCFLALLLLSFFFLIRGLRKAETREKYRALFQKAPALSAGIVLVFFLIIAILDSIHIPVRQELSENHETINQIESLLDKMLSPLDKVFEKTYSAPMAMTLSRKEVSTEAGRVQEHYPRLKYLPQSIQTEADKDAVIKLALVQAFAISLVLTVLSLLGTRGLNLERGSWYFGHLTLFALLFCIIAAYALSRNFHLFGTGKIGQDIFYYTLKSIRTGMIIGTLTTLFLLPFALILGISAGYFGGFVDDIIQYVYTTLSSIPGILLITASVLSIQTYIANHPLQFPTLDQSADARLLALCLILGITSWTSLCRLLRAETLKLREIDFVQAADALGSSAFYIFRKHLLPNVMPIVLITLVLDFSFLVLAEAVLSYVGVGVSPMTISWGNMINGARLELAADPMVWWPILAAFVFMFVLVLALNVFADAVRDVFDPRTN